MSDERFPHAVEPAQDDDALAIVDRELREMLSIGPSAEFAGRVRAAIHADAADRRSAWRPLAAAALIALAAGAAVFGLLPGRGTTPAAPRAVAEARPTQPLAPRTTPTVEKPVARNATREARIPPAAASRNRAPGPPAPNADELLRASEPEVLVDPRQRAALERLVILARGLPESSEPQRATIDAVLAELQVPAVIVELLEVPALPTGGGLPEINIGRR